MSAIVRILFLGSMLLFVACTPSKNNKLVSAAFSGEDIASEDDLKNFEKKELSKHCKVTENTYGREKYQFLACSDMRSANYSREQLAVLKKYVAKAKKVLETNKLIGGDVKNLAKKIASAESHIGNNEYMIKIFDQKLNNSVLATNKLVAEFNNYEVSPSQGCSIAERKTLNCPAIAGSYQDMSEMNRRQEMCTSRANSLNRTLVSLNQIKVSLTRDTRDENEDLNSLIDGFNREATACNKLVSQFKLIEERERYIRSAKAAVERYSCTFSNSETTCSVTSLNKEDIAGLKVQLQSLERYLADIVNYSNAYSLPLRESSEYGALLRRVSEKVVEVKKEEEARLAVNAELIAKIESTVRDISRIVDTRITVSGIPSASHSSRELLEGFLQNLSSLKNQIDSLVKDPAQAEKVRSRALILEILFVGAQGGGQYKSESTSCLDPDSMYVCNEKVTIVGIPLGADDFVAKIQMIPRLGSDDIDKKRKKLRQN